MVNTDRLAIGAIAGLLLLVGSSVADDHVIVFPGGWYVDDEIGPHDASSTGYAVTAYKYKDDDPYNLYDQSIVIQSALGGSTYTTEFSGKVYGLSYSPTGSHLLVRQVESGGSSAAATHRVHLLGSNGEILWTKVDERAFYFSTTGEVVYAWDPGTFFGGGLSVQLFDLGGEPLKVVSVDIPPMGVVVVGDGSSVIFQVKYSVFSLDTTTSPPTENWRIDLGSEYPKAMFARLIDSDRFVVRQDRGVAIVVGVNGTLEFTYDSQALGDANVILTPNDYAQYRMYAGPAPGTISLFKGTSGTFTLVLLEGELTPRSITTDRPSAAFKLGPHLLNQNLFFFSRAEVRVRDVSGE